MPSSTQTWSIVGTGGETFRGADTISAAYSLTPTQAGYVAQAMGLWDDVSAFTATQRADNSDLAREAQTPYYDWFGLGDDVYFGGDLPGDWTRVMVGDFNNPHTLGVNFNPNSEGTDSLYHEVYIGRHLDGYETMQPGTVAFSVLVHELGHSVLGPRLDPHYGFRLDEEHKHIEEDGAFAIMDPSEDTDDPTQWHPATPMSRDIDYVTLLYGPATDTRTGDDTYGFNAHLSGAPREAFDFSINTQPYVTIFDNGGTDTLDASGFRDTAGNARRVHINLTPGSWSYMLDGYREIFAVIYQGVGPTTWIENAVGGDANDELHGNNGLNTLIGGGGRDLLDGEVDGIVDTLVGGADDDVYYVGEYEIIVEGPGGGIDTIVSSAAMMFTPENVENIIPLSDTTTMLYFAGNELNNQLRGSFGDDVLIGYGGVDLLEGGGGADRMDGGNGNDTYEVDNVGDQVIEAPNWQFVYVGSSLVLLPLGGNDTVRTSLEVYELDDDVENLIFTGTEGHAGVGNALDNVMIGSSGADSFLGEGGNDTLDGGGGDDVMAGGADNDIYIVDSAGDKVTEETFSPLGFWYDSGGIDEVRTDLSVYSLRDEWFSTVENLTFTGTGLFIGTGNSADNVISGGNDLDVLSGEAGSDRLYGNDGVDILVGGGGNDGMDGGRGNDTFIIDNGNEISGDVVVGGDDYDKVVADESVAATGLNLALFATDFGPRPEVHAGQSAAVDVEEVIGGSGNDRVDASWIAGRGGFGGANVTFNGKDGDDTFIAGAPGSFWFNGGIGDDTIEYFGAASRYEIRRPNGSAAEASISPTSVVVMDRTTGRFDVLDSVEHVRFGDGTTISVADALRAGVTLIGTESGDTLTGGDLNDRLEGRGGSDYLTGGRGADQLLGGAGMDFLYVDAEDTLIDGGDGFDYLYLDSSSPTGASFRVANTNVEAIAGTLAADRIDATGVTYGLFINGNYGNDVLIGGAGNDSIDGSADHDTLTGGAGRDTFRFAGSWGNDTVTDFTRGQDVLDFTGVAALTGMSQLAITSTAAGARIGYGSNSIVLQGVSASSLTAADFLFTQPPAPAPGLTLIGTAGSDTLTGGAGNDRLEGRDGMDFLTGGAGADQLLGGAGTDFLYVDAADTLIDGGDGFDYLYLDSSSPTGANFRVAGTNVEMVSGTLQADRIDATGVTYGVSMNGNYGNDVLIGGSGNDRLDGSADNDTLTGAGGRDTFYFAGAWGRDTITDFTRGQDYIDLAGVTSMSQLAITNTAAGASIAFGVNSILLQGVSASSLTASDFHFLG